MPSRAKKRGTAPQAGGASVEVEDFLARLEHPLKREVLALRSIVRAVDPRIAEGIKWNAPSFFTTAHFATFHLRHRDRVQVVLHLDAQRRDVALRGAIGDPGGLLEWRGEDRATVAFRDLADIDAKREAFAAILRQWITFVP
jgi:hypothetical protein